MSSPQQSQALAKRNADTALMPPPPAPKRIKRPTKVLDEDVYTDTLSHIIARDFFPGLLEMQAQTEYLEALDSRNNDWIRDAGRKLHQAMTPGPGGQRGRRGTSVASNIRATSLASTVKGSRWDGATPRRAPVSATPAMSTASDDDGRPNHQVDADLSLGAFQTKYTSEDNESFNALLDKQNLKRAQKYAFLYNSNKIPTNRQIEYRAQQSQLLLADQANDGTNRSLVPLRPSQDLDDRPAQIDSFKSRQGPRNSFMFAPDGIEDSSLTTVAQAAQDASLAPPKSVSYAATRLPTTADPSSSTVPPSPSMSAIDAAIAGHPRPSTTDAGSYTGSETPRVRGYAFVDTEPEPHELLQQHGQQITDEDADREEQEHAMRLILSANEGFSSTTGKSGGFKLQTQSKRETLHHSLVDKQSSARRKGLSQRPGSGVFGGLGSAPTPGRTPSTPGFGGAGPPRKGGNLTPAARMLAARIGGIKNTPGREQGASPFGQERGESRAWTPTPRVKRE